MGYSLSPGYFALSGIQTANLKKQKANSNRAKINKFSTRRIIGVSIGICIFRTVGGQPGVLSF